MKWTVPLAVALMMMLAATAHAADRPNVLLICVDDLKPVIACYGDPHVKTPNLDRLAARGVRFERAYCNQAVCSPSRNALLTGYRPQSLGIYDLPTNFRKSMPSVVTMPQHFLKAGYRTEAMGKIFHIGHGNTDDAASWSVPHFQAKAIGYARKENQGPTREGARFENKNPKDLPRGAPFENADVPDNTYADGIVADEAIRRLSSAKGPFFMAVGFIRPHLPFNAPAKYWALYDPAKLPMPKRAEPPAGAPNYAPQFGGELRQYRDVPEQGPLSESLTRSLIHGYYAAVSYMDAQLGRVLDTLDASPHAKNTIIVLWGDHGWHLGDHGMWCKHTNYEQATRIPVIVAAPGIAAGVSQAMIETVDILPTLAALAGLPKPDGDGLSFEPQLRDVSKSGRDHVVHVYPRATHLGRAIRTERYRMVEWSPKSAAETTAKTEFELYDYQSDPDETRNLAESEPKVLATMQAILAKHPAAKPQLNAKAAK
jgi:iduronate 2-sulfatase